MYQIFTENIREKGPYERKSLKLTKLPFILSHEKQSNLFKIFLHLINIEISRPNKNASSPSSSPTIIVIVSR